MKKLILITMVLMLVVSCGSSSATKTAPVAAGNTVTINGSAVAGQLNGTVTAQSTGGQTQSANVVAGVFTMSVPLSWLASPLTFTAVGNYRDEVSGQMVNLTATSPLRLYAAANTLPAGGGRVALTPGSTVIATLIQQGMSDVYANQLFQNTFGYLPVSSAAVFDPYMTSPQQAAALAANDPYAAGESFRVGVFSQLAADMGLSNPLDIALLPQTIANDLTDRVWDGQANMTNVIFLAGNINARVLHQAIPFSSRLELAVSRFAASPANVAALNAPPSGLPPQKGELPGVKKLLTLASGVVVQLQMDVAYSAPFQAGFLTGRTHHVVTLTNTMTGLPINTTLGTSVVSSLQVPSAMMYRYNGDQYTALISTLDMTQAALGIYAFDVYYPLADTGAGLWELQLDIVDRSLPGQAATVSTRFYPHVAAGHTMVAASHVADQWLDGFGVAHPRSYYLAMQDMKPNIMGGRDLTVYAFLVDLMAGAQPKSGQYQPLLAGANVYGSINGGVPATYVINSVVLEVMNNGVWQLMSPVVANPGQYIATNLLGYVVGANTLQFRLTVNGNSMLGSNGLPPSLSVNLP